MEEGRIRDPKRAKGRGAWTRKQKMALSTRRGRDKKAKHEKHPCPRGTASSQGRDIFFRGWGGISSLYKMASWSRDGLSFHVGIAKEMTRTEMPSSLVVASPFAPLYPSIATHPLSYTCARA